MPPRLSKDELRAWIQTTTPGDFPPATFNLMPAVTVINVELWLDTLKTKSASDIKDELIMGQSLIYELEKAREIWSLENIRKLREMLF